MSENPANLERFSEDALEAMLLEASSLPGRQALAKVTAIRTILRRRAQPSPDEVEANARRALELVNATRGSDEQLTEVHPVWVDSILAAPEWAELYASDAEIRRGRVIERKFTSNRREQ